MTMPNGTIADYPIDIRSVRATYDDAARLTVVVRFWTLEKKAWSRSMISIFDATNVGTYIQVEKKARQPLEVRRMQYGPEPFTCEARFKTDYSALTMTFVVPASCINRWGSIEVMTSVFTEKGTTGWVDYGAVLKVQG